MKLPSFKTVTENASISLKRFPIPLLIAFIGTAIAIYLVDDIQHTSSWILQTFFTCFIGLPLMLGCHLLAERLQKKREKVGVLATGVVLLVLYGLFFAPNKEFDDRTEVFTFFVLCICMHLWVSVAGYITQKERYGFWRFNDILFIRIVLSVIFSGVLFGGLALALGSLEQLFNINLHNDIYLKLWLFVGGVFNTWFFLSGIPQDYQDVDTEKPFPKGLKVFTQYILVPLAIVYLLILYAYGLKIVFAWSLPKGWVSALILFYSIVGILAILLVYPLRDSAQNAWVKLFAKFFFIAIMPLIVLLFVAIYTRVSDYGITEPRYYLIMLGCWLTIMSLYYTFSRDKNMKLIPISLLVFGLLSLFGPWNVFNVSKSSQQKRLVKLFTQYSMIVDDKISKPEKDITEDDAEQMRAVIRYLVDNNHHESLSDVYSIDVQTLSDSLDGKHDRWRANSKLKDTLYAMSYIKDHVSKSYDYYYVKAEDRSFDISGYSQAYHIDHWYLRSKRGQKIILIDSTELNLSHSHGIITIMNGETEVSKIVINELGKSLALKGDKDKLPISEMSIKGTGQLNTKLVLYSVNLDDSEGTVSNIEGFLLIE